MFGPAWLYKPWLEMAFLQLFLLSPCQKCEVQKVWKIAWGCFVESSEDETIQLHIRFLYDIQKSGHFASYLVKCVSKCVYLHSPSVYFTVFSEVSGVWGHCGGQIMNFCHFLHLCLRHGVIMWPCLVWNLLCRLHSPWTLTAIHLPLPPEFWELSIDPMPNSVPLVSQPM